jgi:CubicO group peptidase (beta-lactamase class C family)
MKFGIPFIILLFSSCYLSEELPPDQTIWEYGVPSSVSLDQDALLYLNYRIKKFEFQQIQGLIIIKDGKLVFENYYQGDNRKSINSLNGASMSFTVAAIGVALDKGLLSLDDKIEKYLPAYAEVFAADNNKTFITIGHLLLNKSGLSWNEQLFDLVGGFTTEGDIIPNLQNDINKMKESEDWVRYVLEKPMEAPAGVRFSINSGTGVILAKIIENISDESYDNFLSTNVLNPLSINSLILSQDSLGLPNGGDGVFISLLDWTKFGYLMLNEGIWKGRRILDPNFVNEVAGFQTSVDNQFTSGYIWRQFGDSFQDKLGIDHKDIYFIPGEFGQHMYIIPSKKMIVAMDAENYFSPFGNPSLNLLTEITFMIQ